MQIYSRMLERVEALRGITDYSKKMLCDMTNKVIQNLASGYDKVRERMGNVMGGHLIVTDLVRARHEGLAEGRAEGKASMIEAMLRNGKKPEEISDFCGLQLEEIQEIQDRMLQMA